MPNMRDLKEAIEAQPIVLTLPVPNDEAIRIEFRPYAQVQSAVEALPSFADHEQRERRLTCERFALCCASWNLTEDGRPVALTADALFNSAANSDQLEWLITKAYGRARRLIADVDVVDLWEVDASEGRLCQANESSPQGY